jgi:hypothetical protein
LIAVDVRRAGQGTYTMLNYWRKKERRMVTPKTKLAMHTRRMVNGRACGETDTNHGGEARQTEQTDRNEPREHQPFQVSPFPSFPAPSPCVRRVRMSNCAPATLTRLYRHLYKCGSSSSVTKDLDKSTSQPKSYYIKETTYIHHNTQSLQRKI